MYVVATTTKVDVSGVEVPDRLNDDYFKRKRENKGSRKSAGDIFADASKSYKVSEQRKEDQRVLDDAVMEAVGKVSDLRGYLRSTFSLQKGQYPHQMVF